MVYRFTRRLIFFLATISSAVYSQLVTDPLPYAPIANPLPDTMSQLRRDSVNLNISRIRLNQAGYRPQDEKLFYYVGTASSFSVLDAVSGAEAGSGTFTSTGETTTGKLDITCYYKATLTAGGDIKYHLESPTVDGTVMEGFIPDLPKGSYKIKVGTEESAPFYIGEDVYTMVKDVLIKYYGIARCGDNDSWFHDDCHMKDPVVGGWHDAGDHLKIPQSIGYAFSVLALCAAALQDRDHDVYAKNQAHTVHTDGIPDVLVEAKVGADYIYRSYTQGGNTVPGMKVEIGDFGKDHSWWGRPENQDYMQFDRGGPIRPDSLGLGGNTAGSLAAGMAIFGKIYKPYDSVYAATCIKIAAELYTWGKAHQTAAYNGAMSGGGRTNDELAFAALGLWWATNEDKYRDELLYDKNIGVNATPATYPRGGFSGGWMTSKQPGFLKDMANTDWDNLDTYVLWGLYRLILKDETTALNYGIDPDERLNLIEDVISNIIANIGSVSLTAGGGETITLPVQDFAWKQNILASSKLWGWMHIQQNWMENRYQAGNITDVYCYYDIASKIQGMELPHNSATTDWKVEEVKSVLLKQLNYMLGMNPWDVSMIVGAGDKNLNHPHHRASNPELVNVPGKFYQYIPPVGALTAGYLPTVGEYLEFMGGNSNPWFHTEISIDATTSIFLPVMGLAKEDTIGAPTATVRIVHVGCNKAVIEIEQSRLGTADIYYSDDSLTYVHKASDTTDVFHRIVLDNLTSGITYTFNVMVSDLFGRDTVIKYLDEEKNLVDFSFTTLQNCPTNADIVNVKVCRVTYDSAYIFWYTPNGEFDSKVVYGTEKPPTTLHDGDITGHPVQAHYVGIGGLQEQTTYYFYVQSGESIDNNQGLLYEFTTPVMHVDFDVRAVRYSWNDQPGVGINVVNQDARPYDSLDLRLYFRAEDGFETDLGARLDICVLYRADGFQDQIEGELRTRIWNNLVKQKPVKMPDTFDPTDNTYAYYLSLPLWDVEMQSQSRIRLDIIFDTWEKVRMQELLGQAPEHQITDRDWSFGPHSRENGDPVDFPGVAEGTKNDIDTRYWETPVNPYICVYRKGEYIWGYSPSQAEMKTKKNYYTITSQVETPVHNPTEDYVAITQTSRFLEVSGWAIVEPIDGMLNEIWVNGVKKDNIERFYTHDPQTNRYDFTIPVPVHNKNNNVDIFLFAGPAYCDSCYGCAYATHHFVADLQGILQDPSVLVLRNEAMEPISDTMKLDTSQFHIQIKDKNGNLKGKKPDAVTVWIKNFDNGDSITVTLTETGDSTGVFQTVTPISVVDRTPDQSGPQEIALNGGDRVRIWYIDPTDSTDMSEVYITSKATFPIARDGYLKDTDGNGAVDLITLRYSIALKELPDSIEIDFPSAASTITLRAGADAMDLTENVVNVIPVRPLTVGVTGFSTALCGVGRSYLTYNSMVKKSDFQVDDSIGPVCVGQALVKERLEPGFDTLTFTASEALKLGMFVGEVLMLRRGGTDHSLQVQGITASQGNTMTLIVDAGGLQFIAGDSLRFNSVTSVMDLAGNIPHTANRPVPVVIKASIPRVEYAYYYDLDFNGVLDVVRMGFNKMVNLNQLAIGFRWNTQQTITVDNTTISFTDETTTEMKIPLTAEITQDLINTGGTLFNTLSSVDVSGDTVVTMVEDSAAPVISTARFLLYSGEMNANNAMDTLLITFSEPVTDESVTGVSQFPLYSNERNTGYTFNVTGSHKLSQKEYRFFGLATIVPFPIAGDTIWLDPVSAVSDAAQNRQTSPDNRHVAVIVGDVSSSLNDVEITVSPNPVIIQGLYADSAAVIKLIPKNMRFEIQIDSSARAVIYDKVGNRITDLTSRSVPGGAEIIWNGTNKNGRFVGTGSYLCFIYFMGEKRSVMIGVRRR